ncbi:DUF11 domain-containing protein [Stieleria sp. JC731]|uniref:DUF11 domain-containing protein n=1 Tax=Pirellulaceae TaxID=2691357 RepID=UPI001E2D97B5|nr:DUF11 domain-containing protein [Stieleria sp. JC731]MCC9599836.1 DUF11 domain-containing protein [Stieleria sp. JC731]
MLRGRFKNFAIYSLIGIMTGGPAWSATPGNASRSLHRKSGSASSTGAVQSAFGVREPGQQDNVRQVVGKQPAAPTKDTDRTLSFIPRLLSGTSSDSTSPTTTSQNHQAQPGGRTNAPKPRGILNDLFGVNNNSHQDVAAEQTVRASNDPPPPVNWDGIPYHQAKSQSRSSNPTPIRDPRPGEARMSNSGRVASSNSARLTRQPETPQLDAPTLPKAPSLETAATSSRRTSTPPAKVVSSKIEAERPSTLSPLSSSRRSDRRSLPTLDASEIAAARNAKLDEEDLVPKISRRRIKPDANETAKSTKLSENAVSGSLTDQSDAPKASPTPVADKVAAADKPKVDAPSAPKVQSKPVPAKTPSAEIATKAAPQPATNPAETNSPAETNRIAGSAASSNPSVETAEPSAPTQFNTANLTTPAPAVATNDAATNNIAGVDDNQSPRFVKPTMSAPAAPKFGPRTNVVSGRVGPPASEFHTGNANNTMPNSVHNFAQQPNSGVAQPKHDAALKPSHVPLHPATGSVAGTPIGSGIAVGEPHPATSSLSLPAATAPQPQASIARAPQMHRPLPETAPGSSALGTPEQSPQPYVNSVSNLPSASTPEHRVAANQSPSAPYVNAPFTENQARSSAAPNAQSELSPDETAVASELPGIRVVTQGPRRLIIRQTEVFEIRVENRGSIDAEGVMVRTSVPDWADLKGQSASRGQLDPPNHLNNRRLVWALDRLPAGSNETMYVRLQALQSGSHELDVDWTLVPQKSVAKVEVREPKLDLVIEGPEDVVYGESQTYKVRVLNPGDGIAPNVVFTLSPNSPTPQTQRIGNIPSGKEAQFEVELTAQDLGDLKIHGFAAGDLGLKSEAEKTIKVLAAELEAVLVGPELKYQNTDAIYQLQLTNKGTATSKNVQASLGLPPGTRYVDGINEAVKRGNKLTWQIESLPPGATREYEFTCNMTATGNHTFDFMATGSAAGQTAVALETQVESIADLVLSINDPAAPAPVGSEVTYEIVIKNRGSRAATDVRAVAQFSKGIEPRRIDGHSGQVLTGQVLIDPISSIRPGEEVRIHVIAEAESDGHHRFRTEIRSGETVLVSEEATHYMSRRSERVSRRSTTSR